MHRFFHRVLFCYFLQVLAHGLLHLSRFCQLLAWNPAFLGCVRFHETAIHRKVLALHQVHFHALPHDLLKQLLEQLRFLEAAVAVLGERGVMRNLLIETQTGEPPPSLF
jgi:hypothetical protein